MSDYILVNGELYHHGVKGMKWGVRKYQNKDGSLTAAGKKKYYNEVGFLTNDGRRQQDANSRKIYAQSMKIRKEISKDPEYSRTLNEMKKSNTENREYYKDAYQRWSNQTDFKKMDYYRFKEAAYDRWISSDAGKRETANKASMRNVIEKKVKETIGEKAFNQTVPELNSYPMISSLGKDYVNRILNVETYS